MRQYLYLCTSKASKLSTSITSLRLWRRVRVRRPKPRREPVFLIQRASFNHLGLACQNSPSSVLVCTRRIQLPRRGDLRISCRQREGCSLNIRRSSTLATAPIYDTHTHTCTHATSTRTHTHMCQGKWRVYVIRMSAKAGCCIP